MIRPGHYLLGNVVLLYGFPPLVGASLPTLLFIAGGFLRPAPIALNERCGMAIESGFALIANG